MLFRDDACARRAFPGLLRPLLPLKFPLFAMTVPKFSFFLLSFGAAILAVPLAKCADDPPPSTNPTAASERLTLDAAIAEALAKNPAFQVINAEIAAAQGEIVTAQTRPNAELSFAPGMTRSRDGGTSYRFHGVVEYSRPIVFAGKRELLVAIAQRNVDLRRLGIDGLKFQLAANVRKAFYELLAAQRIVGLREQQLDSARTFQQAAARRAESGYASDFEAVRSQGDVINAQKLLRAAQGQITAARTELNLLMGRDPAGPLQADGSLDNNAPAFGVSALVGVALEKNPSLRAQAMQAEIAGLNVRRARYARKPEWSIGPSLEFTPSEQILGFGASVSLPNKNTGRGELLTATAEQRRVAAETERLRREIAGAVAKAAVNLGVARDQVALYAPAYLDQLKAVVEQAERSYAQNATSLLIYLDARRTYFDTLASYYESIADLASSRAELESAIGISLDSIPAQPAP